MGFIRAGRFHDEMEAFPLPFAHQARSIVLYAGSDWTGAVPQDIARTVCRLIQTQMIDPAIAALPWLAGEFRLTDA